MPNIFTFDTPGDTIGQVLFGRQCDFPPYIHAVLSGLTLCDTLCQQFYDPPAIIHVYRPTSMVIDNVFTLEQNEAYLGSKFYYEANIGTWSVDVFSGDCDVPGDFIRTDSGDIWASYFGNCTTTHQFAIGASRRAPFTAPSTNFFYSVSTPNLFTACGIISLDNVNVNCGNPNFPDPPEPPGFSDHYAVDGSVTLEFSSTP